MILLCKGTCDPVVPLSKIRRAVSLSYTPVPAYLVMCIWLGSAAGLHTTALKHYNHN